MKKKEEKKNGKCRFVWCVFIDFIFFFFINVSAHADLGRAVFLDLLKGCNYHRKHLLTIKIAEAEMIGLVYCFCY